MMAHDDIFLIETARPGATGGNVATVDWTTIRSDVDGLLLRPNITALGAVPDVDTSGVAEGDTLLWDATANGGAGGWITAVPSPGLTLYNATDLGTPYEVDNLYVGSGIQVTEVLGITGLVPAYGGTGSANSVARSDHAHTVPSLVRSTFGQGGYLGSGSRSLASVNATLADGIEYLVVATLNMQMRGADPGACYYRLSVTIDGDTRQSNGGSSGFWCVQGVPDKTTWVHHRTLTGTGAAVTCSASVAYHSGGGFYTDAGELEVRLSPAR